MENRTRKREVKELHLWHHFTESASQHLDKTDTGSLRIASDSQYIELIEFIEVNNVYKPSRPGVTTIYRVPIADIIKFFHDNGVKERLMPP